MSTEARKKKRIQNKPATLKEIVTLAEIGDGLTSDEAWCVDETRWHRLSGWRSELDLAVAALPNRVEKSLGRRLARAEAERLRGSLLEFERATGKLTFPVPKARQDEAKAASDRFNVALCVFMAMARGL